MPRGSRSVPEWTRQPVGAILQLRGIVPVLFLASRMARGGHAAAPATRSRHSGRDRLRDRRRVTDVTILSGPLRSA
jgi:hypothetical protein